MSLDRAGQGFEIVSSFERGDDPSPGVFFGCFHDESRDPGKVLFIEEKTTKGIVAVGIEPS